MPALGDATLSDAERRVVDRAVRDLRFAFGERLRSVWLYGSRARGETPHAESDVDLLVVLDTCTWDDRREALNIVSDAAEAEGLVALSFSVFTYDVERLAQRREIKSFFIQEVDRDKLVLAGKP